MCKSLLFFLKHFYINKYKLQLHKFGSVPVTNNLLFSALSRGIRTAVWCSLRKTASSRQKRNPSASTAASPTARTGLHSRRWVTQVPSVHVGDLLALQGVFGWHTCVFVRCGWTANTGSRAASRPAAVRTQRAAAAHQNPTMSHLTTKASHQAIRKHSSILRDE